MRNSKEIEQDISNWFNKLDLGLSIIPINDLLLEYRESVISETKSKNIPIKHWEELKEQVNKHIDVCYNVSDYYGADAYEIISMYMTDIEEKIEKGE